MTDQEQPPRSPDEGESQGPARPPPTSGSPPMTATRMRLGTGRGGAPAARPAPQPEPSTLPPNEGPESMAQPATPSNVAGEPNVPAVDPARATPAPPSPAARPVADSTSPAATEGPDAGTHADQAAATAARSVAPARPAAPAAAPARPAGAPDTPARSAPPAEPPAAAPAIPPEPGADPEVVVGLREVLPDLEWKRDQGYVELRLPRARLLEIAQRLRDHFDYDYLASVTAVDWLDRIEMVYHLYSFNYRRRPDGLVLRVDLERPEFPDYPLCPSLTKLWPGADFQEREVYDLMGVKFVGHPDLRRILLADDFPGHPLRKDFVFDYEYVLVRHLAYGVEGQFASPASGSRSPDW